MFGMFKLEGINETKVSKIRQEKLDRDQMVANSIRNNRKRNINDWSKENIDFFHELGWVFDSKTGEWVKSN